MAIQHQTGAAQAILAAVKQSIQIHGPAAVHRGELANGQRGLGAGGSGAKDEFVDVSASPVFVLGVNALGDGVGLA